MAQEEGFCVCSGGIIGMGETWEDRLDMAVSLAELGDYVQFLSMHLCQSPELLLKTSNSSPRKIF